jgi:hypothetical protein
MLALSALLVLFIASTQSQEPEVASIEKAAPSCVGSIASYPHAPAVYQIVPDATVPNGLANAAASAWNNPACNPGGTGFPTFTTAPTPGAVQVPVHVAPGINPNNGRSCGQFDDGVLQPAPVTPPPPYLLGPRLRPLASERPRGGRLFPDARCNRFAV